MAPLIATIVRLGNPSVHESKTEKGKIVGYTQRADLGHQVTELHLPHELRDVLLEQRDQLEKAISSHSRADLLTRLLDNQGLPEWAKVLRHVAGVVSQHARAGVEWVHCEDADLQHVFSAFYGAHVLALSGPERDLAEILELADHERARWETINDGIEGPTALKTTAGVDLAAGNVFGTSATVAQLNYVALTANEEAPKTSNTSLAGEITTAEGGLLRKLATYAHTTGTATATLTVTFTANPKDALPVTVHKFGVFNKSVSGGTMGIETALTATTFNAAEDNATLTETLTIT